MTFKNDIQPTHQPTNDRSDPLDPGFALGPFLLDERVTDGDALGHGFNSRFAMGGDVFHSTQRS